MPARSVAPRIPPLPGSSCRSRCLSSRVLPRGGERRLEAPPEVGRVWGFPGSFPAPLPRIFAAGVRSPEQEAGFCGRGCSRAGCGSPLCPALAETTAGLCRSRPCLGAPSPFARAAATGCLWPEGASRYFERELRSNYGRKIASQKQPWGIEVLVQPHSKAVSRALEGQSAFCFLSGKSRFRPSLQVGHSPGFAPSHHSVPRAMLGGCPSTRMRGKGRLGAPLLVPLQGGRAGGP